jgi:hypothetical protein
MSIRVVDVHRWRRVKISILSLAWLTGVASIGGLESEGLEPIPSPAGFVISAAVCLAMMWNLHVTDPRRRQ